MRPLEIVLTSVNALSLAALLIPRLARIRRVSCADFITLVVAGLQVLVEGYRWQMVPGNYIEKEDQKKDTQT